MCSYSFLLRGRCKRWSLCSHIIKYAKRNESAHPRDKTDKKINHEQFSFILVMCVFLCVCVFFFFGLTRARSGSEGGGRMG
jgi:hypothetical protein